jgi:NAD(P)-dependent dehydrogenase (short-subunit alcohol dehydrogenase family)
MTADPFDLTGCTALVVGASRGLGREAALALARRGADVVCAARSEAPLQVLAEEIAAIGRGVKVLVVDAADETALTACVDEAAAGRGLDVLVYAAGLMHAGAAVDTTVQDWDRLLQVNLTGAFVAAKQSARHMKARGGRMIFFSTSFIGRVLPFTLAYGVSKGGLQQLVQSLAVEWARYGIRVNAIAPGYFETEMPRAVLDNPELRQRVLARIPLRRFGQPAEIGPLVSYLASDASAFMTGAVLRIDGGQSLHVS